MGFLNKILSDENVEKSYALFIFILIIGGNFIAELFPCKIQNVLRNNIYMKHLLGFLILFFFGILEVPSLANIHGMASVFLLYIFFLITNKINEISWIIVFIGYSIVYLLHVIKTDYDSKAEDKETYSSKDILWYQSMSAKIIDLQKIILIFNIVVTVFGFLLYMGEKKIEYKKNFNYLNFMFGKPTCRTSSPTNLTIEKMLKAAFS